MNAAYVASQKHKSQQRIETPCGHDLAAELGHAARQDSAVLA